MDNNSTPLVIADRLVAQVPKDGPRAAMAASRLLSDAAGPAGFLDVPQDSAAVEAVLSTLSRIPDRISKVLVLGIGGSGLGAQAGLMALGRRPGGREVRVLANIDPVSVAEALDWFDPKDTLVNVVTKSGNTVETLTQLAIFADRIRSELGHAGLAEGLVVTTDPEKGPVRRLASRLGCQALAVPPRVGGRFSVLTAVGLFPFAAAGLDICKMLEGATSVLKAFRDSPDCSHPAVASAAIHETLLTRGVCVRVLWAYCDRLAAFGDWFVQLWAESLGKAGFGQTPVRAIGSTDQHSLLQLFMEGPKDKCFTFVTVGQGEDLRVPDMSDLDPALAEFSGLAVGEVFDALRKGTMAALAAKGCPVLSIHVPVLDEGALGALFMHFEIETAVAGYMRGIDPFDQPGVEAGKLFAHGLLGKPGMERYRDEALTILGEKR